MISAARLLRQAALEARGEAEASQESMAAAGDAPTATWRELRVLELPPSEAVTAD